MPRRMSCGISVKLNEDKRRMACVGWMLGRGVGRRMPPVSMSSVRLSTRRLGDPRPVTSIVHRHRKSRLAELAKSRSVPRESGESQLIVERGGLYPIHLTPPSLSIAAQIRPHHRLFICPIVELRGAAGRHIHLGQSMLD